MRYSSVWVVAAALAAGLLPDGASAQRRRPPQRHESAITINRGQATIEPFAGYLITQSYVNGPLSTTLGTSSAPLFGAQLSIPLAPSASLVGTAGYSSGNLRAGIPFLGGYDFGKSTTWVFDGAVELRAENLRAGGKRIVPFAQLGAGALRRQVGVSGVNVHSTDFVVSGGAGINIPLSSSADISVMAKDYYGKADFGSIGSYDVSTKDIHTLGLTGGIRIGF